MSYRHLSLAGYLAEFRKIEQVRDNTVEQEVDRAMERKMKKTDISGDKG